jgi:ketosteroid isomerase-like protein
MTERTEIERMLDERAIRTTLAQYCRAVGRMDMDLLRTLYTDTATVDAGSPADGDIAGYLDYIASGIERGIGKVPIVLGQTLFTFDGDTAWTETYLHAAHEKTVDGEVVQVLFFGRYLDRLVRTGDRWLIDHRKVVYDWVREEAVPEGSTAHLNVAGARSGEDASYAFLAGRA